MTMFGSTPEPRWLHPGAWWLWALGLATAASRTTNPLLLALIIAVLAFVVSARKPDAPWGRSFSFFVRLAVVVIVVRVLIQLVFSAQIGTTTLLALPGIPLPEWMAGVRLGGPVTLESLLLALYDGLRLATILLAVGAANSLASPTRLLKSVPAALYELGVSVVVAMTFTPQLVADVQRVQHARRLRGRPTRGARALAGATMPVLEGALDRSVALAAAMDSRGYGRRGIASHRARLMSNALMLTALVAAVIGTFGLVSSGSSMAVSVALLVLGLVAGVTALVLAGRTRVRTRYRVDPWRAPEWAVAMSGLFAGTVVALSSWLGVAWLHTPADPPTWPSVPLVPALAILVAALPAFVAPPLPISARAQGHREQGHREQGHREQGPDVSTDDTADDARRLVRSEVAA